MGCPVAGRFADSPDRCLKSRSGQGEDRWDWLGRHRLREFRAEMVAKWGVASLRVRMHSGCGAVRTGSGIRVVQKDRRAAEADSAPKRERIAGPSAGSESD